jgi:tetratricopeptide (TPR) repeat protein
MERESGTGSPAEPGPVEPRDRPPLHVAVDVDTLQSTYKAHIRGPYLRARDLMLLGRFKAAWDALRGIDEPDETRESRALDELIGACSIRVAEPLENALFFEATLNLAQEAGDRASESRALYNIGVARFLAGQTAVAWRLFEQARTVAQSIPSRLCGSYACYGLYRVLERTGKAAEAEEMLRRVERLLAEQQSAMVAMRIFLGAEYDCEQMAESLEENLRGKPGPFGAPVEEQRRLDVAEKARERGHFRLADRLLESVRRSAHDAGRHKDEVLALYAIATNWMVQKNYAAAIPPLQRALAMNREHGTVTDVATVLTVLGSALAANGDTAGGAARLVESYRYCRDHEDIERARQAAAELVAVAVKHGFFDELPGICPEPVMDEAELAEIMDKAQEYRELTFPPDPDGDPPDDDLDDE